LVNAAAQKHSMLSIGIAAIAGVGFAANTTHVETNVLSEGSVHQEVRISVNGEMTEVVHNESGTVEITVNDDDKSVRINGQPVMSTIIPVSTTPGVNIFQPIESSASSSISGKENMRRTQPIYIRYLKYLAISIYSIFSKIPDSPRKYPTVHVKSWT